MHNFIEIFHNALSDDTCFTLCNIADSLINSNDKDIDYVDDEGRKDYNIFTEQHHQFDCVLHEVKKVITSHTQYVLEKYYISSSSVYLHENIKVQKSQANGGFVSWHFEQGQGTSSNRALVWMIYLNDVTKGGRTEFKFQEVSVQPTRGTLLVWPASYTHIHRAAPDLQEDKYIATGWWCFNRPRV